MQISEYLDVLMFCALALGILSGAPVAFTLAGIALIFAALGLAFGIVEPRFLLELPLRIFGTMTNMSLTAVPLFILMGAILERSKIAEDLLTTMGDLFGSLRGGLLFATTIVGALLAASTGVVGATVVTMGLLSLPVMLARGYDKSLATGSIAAAGTLGQIIPPSIVLILLGDQLANATNAAREGAGHDVGSVSVGDLFAGALIPGLLLVALYLAYQAAYVFFKPAAAPPGPARLPSLGRLVSALAAPLGLILAVLGSIMVGAATPTEGAAVGAAGSMLLAGWRLATNQSKLTRAIIGAGGLAGLALIIMRFTVDLRLGRPDATGQEQALIWLAVALALVFAAALVISGFALFARKALQPAVRSTVEITAMVFTILIGATLFSAVFQELDGKAWVTHMLSNIPGGLVGALIVVNIAIFLLGFFIDFIEICSIVVPLTAPALIMMGADPVWLGVLLAMNLQTSFLTPPFGFALFYLRGVAPPEVRTMDIYKGSVPFIGLQIVGLLAVAFFPWLATWLPGILYR
ncbi:MAG: TRAP transporter large permease [Caulobacterales bacterium]